MKRLIPLFLFAVAVGLTFHSSPAAAGPATISCGTAIDGYFNQWDWLDVVGTRVTARGNTGFSAFTMRDGYNVATTPLHTSGAATQSVFSAYKGNAHFTGPFSEVFPGRGNSDVDREDFWVSRTGTFWLRAITWGGTWTQLQNVICYSGPGTQTVVTGYIHIPGWGTDFWTFVLWGDRLI